MPPFLCPEGMGGGAGSPAAKRGRKSVTPDGVTIPLPDKPEQTNRPLYADLQPGTAQWARASASLRRHDA